MNILKVDFNSDPMVGLKNDIRSLQAQKAEQVELKKQQIAEKAAEKAAQKAAKEDEKYQKWCKKQEEKAQKAAQREIEKAEAKQQREIEKQQQLLNIEKDFLQDNPNCPYSYEISPKGVVIDNSYENYITALETMSFTAGNLRYNKFMDVIEFNGEPVTDNDHPVIKRALSQELNVKTINKDCYFDALSFVACNNAYNPVEEYMATLHWDGIQRADELFIKYLGVEDTQLVRIMTHKWLYAAVKRIFEPGCKFDNILLLTGPSGGGKSTIFQKLALEGRKNYSLFCSNIDIETNYAEKLKRAWIVSFDEICTLKKKEVERIKTFFSETSDSQRLAYRREVTTYKRHVVFCGSTNEMNFLKDSTVSVERRYWVLETTRTMQNCIIQELTDEIVDQIWAEALHWYQENKNLYMDLSSDEIDMMAKQQTKYQSSNEDEIIDYIRLILSRNYTLNSKGEFTDINDFINQLQESPTSLNAHKINKIPIAFITIAVRNAFGNSHFKRSSSYILKAMPEIIDEVKTSKYNGTPTKCFIIKDTNCLNTNDLNELFD